MTHIHMTSMHMTPIHLTSVYKWDPIHSHTPCIHDSETHDSLTCDSHALSSFLHKCLNCLKSLAPLASCKRQRPPDLKNGIVRYHGMRHEDRAKYSCNAGYKLVGDYHMTCLYGKWVGTTPYCDPGKYHLGLYGKWVGTTPYCDPGKYGSAQHRTVIQASMGSGSAQYRTVTQASITWEVGRCNTVL